MEEELKIVAEMLREVSDKYNLYYVTIFTFNGRTPVLSYEKFKDTGIRTM